MLLTIDLITFVFLNVSFQLISVCTLSDMFFTVSLEWCVLLLWCVCCSYGSMFMQLRLFSSRQKT